MTAETLHLKWDAPEHSSSLRFEVSMSGDDAVSRIVYEGAETNCQLADFLPGRTYLFQVRAVDSQGGQGPWSSCLDLVSGPGRPDQVKTPTMIATSSSTVLVSWENPVNNGATITEYILMMGFIEEEEDEDDEDDLEDEEEEDEEEDVEEDEEDSSVEDEGKETEEGTPGETETEKSEITIREEAEREKEEKERIEREEEIKKRLTLLYSGPELSFEARNLDPATTYYCQIQAVNAVGVGAWSPLTACTTLATNPGPVPSLKAVAKSTEIELSWARPQINGSPIIEYNIELNDAFSTAPGTCLQHMLTSLQPETSYKCRIQAVNSVGCGPWSSPIRVNTRPRPPSPPSLECIVRTHNSLKLKWGEGRSNALLLYKLEMENKAGEMVSVYTGNAHTHKIGKLAERTDFHFRICAANEAGEGPFSDISTFTTLTAPPYAPKQPRVCDIGSAWCQLEWSTVRNPGVGSIEYLLQMQHISNATKEEETQQVYRGPDPSFRLTSLSPNTEYHVKACAVRRTEDGSINLIGAYSPTLTFTTRRRDVGAAKVVGGNSATNEVGGARSFLTGLAHALHPRNLAATIRTRLSDLNDQQWAFLWLIVFTVVALVLAFFAQSFFLLPSHQSPPPPKPHDSGHEFVGPRKNGEL